MRVLLKIASVVILFGLIVMPPAARYYFQRRLSKESGLPVTIGRVRLNLLRNRAAAEYIEVKYSDGESLLLVESVEVFYSPVSLLSGHPVFDITVTSPNLMIYSDKLEEIMDAIETPEESAKSNSVTVNNASVRDGTLHYQEGDFEILFVGIDASGENISYNEDSPARYSLTAAVAEGGSISSYFTVRNPDSPVDLDIEVTVDELELSLFNPFISEYAALEVESGTLILEMKATISEGMIFGTITPGFIDIALEAPEDYILDEIWSGIADAAAGLLEYGPHNGVASEITISGDLQDPEVNALDAVIGMLRNSVAGTVMPGLLESVKNPD